MEVIKVHDKCPSIDMSLINIRGLSAGQVALYKHLEKCNKENKPVELSTIAEIYFNIVRKPDGYFENEWWRKNAFSMDDERRNLKNKNAIAYWNRPENINHKKWNIDMPTKAWMKANIGSLVMRGLLSIIPTFDTSLTQEDDAINKPKE